MSGGTIAHQVAHYLTSAKASDGMEWVWIERLEKRLDPAEIEARDDQGYTALGLLAARGENCDLFLTNAIEILVAKGARVLGEHGPLDLVLQRTHKGEAAGADDNKEGIIRIMLNAVAKREIAGLPNETNETEQNPFHVLATQKPLILGNLLFLTNGDKPTPAQERMLSWLREVDAEGNLPRMTLWSEQGGVAAGLQEIIHKTSDGNKQDMEEIALTYRQTLARDACDTDLHILVSASDEFINQQGQTAISLMVDRIGEGITIESFANHPQHLQLVTELSRRELDTQTPGIERKNGRGVRL